MNKKFGLIRVWPILYWKYCMGCDQEYRREWGWIRLFTWDNNSVCKECCPTEKEAYIKLTEVPQFYL